MARRMVLASQVAGALAAGLLVLIFARGLGLEWHRSTGMVAVVAVVAAALLAPPALRSAVESFSDQIGANADLTAEEGRALAGGLAQADVPFLQWVEERVGEDESFQLVVGNENEHPLVPQWTFFQLAPRFAVGRPEKADWIVFYDVKRSFYSRPGFHDVEIYQPGYAIGKFG